MYRIGVDVGGTNTDSAVLDITALDTPSRGVIASAKSPTTRDITGGIELVIKDVLAKSKVQKSNVLSVNIGTTHFVNAVAEADERRLSKVAVVRLCGPFTRQLPPFVDFPVNLKKIIDGGVHYLDGGLEIDGREISPLNLGQIKTVVGKVRNAGIKTIAVVGVFSPLDHSGAHEERCKSIMHQLDPSLEISCSHSIGPPGFLERENATILNASILAAAKIAISGFRNAISRLHLTCPLYLTQNDGTLTDAATALEFPIKTFASGPTNSAIGAAFLGGLDKPREVVDGQPAPQVMVVDIGGTTTDVCALLPSGFPRQAPAFVEVGGVRTAFSMPEVCSIGLGGGSRIGTDTATGQATVGPDSTGHLITSQALVFGGGVMTATDIVVASGKANIGNVALVANIPPTFLKSARQQIKKSLETVIEEMKVSAEPVTVLLVGGGSIVLMDELDGVARCIHPPHHDSANAVGAAIAKVAGEIDVIEVLEGRDEKAVVNSACAKAIQAAIDKGARKDDVKIAAIDKIPLQYVSNKATRIVVKAVGSLGVPKSDMSSQSIHLASLAEAAAEGINWEEVEEESKRHGELETQHSPLKPSLGIDIPNYRPDVKNGVWYLSDVDLEFIASGTGVLGTGGGGPSYHGFLMALDALHNAGPGKMRVISPKSLKDSDICSFGCWYGAPSIINERPSSGTEIQTAIDAVMKISGYTDFQAIVGDEIGGGNGMAAFPVGKYYDKPIVDADGMGRAYPTAEHSTMYIHGYPIAPCVIADAKGNCSVIMRADSNTKLEKMLRATCIELGLGTAVAKRPLEGLTIKDFAVPNTISQSWYIGRAIHVARKEKTSYINGLFDTTPGRLLFSGKIIDVRRDIKAGYTMGSCLLAPLSDNEKDSVLSITSTTDTRHLLVPFQNEYLYAAYTDSDGIVETEIIATVPDLISILGQDGEAIGSQDLRYGLQVNVIGMPAHPLWTGENGLTVGGPEYFKLGMEWKSVGKYERPRSVIEEFDTCDGRD